MSTRAEFAAAIRKVSAERSRLVEPPSFDRHAFAALVAEIDRLLDDGNEARVHRLVSEWQREQLELIEEAVR